MRVALLLLFSLDVLVAGPRAFADDAAPTTFQVIDRGTSVEVIAHNATASRTGVVPIRSRLEVPLAGHPRAAGIAPKDPTVKVVELEDGNLSVKVGYEHLAVMGLAKFAQASQIGPDVHLIFPRIVPADGARIVLPEPTIPAELAKQLEGPKPATAVAPTVATAPVVPAPVMAPPPPPATAPNILAPVNLAPKLAPESGARSDVVKLDATPPDTASGSRPPERAKPQKPEVKTPEPNDDPWSKLAMYGAVGLAGVGCGSYLLKKKRANQGPLGTIDVIAQKSLGGKAKIVWFTAGGREMVVAVTPQAIRMLGQWDRPADGHIRNSNLPTAQTIGPEPKPAPSSAVSGILKLREKAGPAFSKSAASDGDRRAAAPPWSEQLDSEVATGDIHADALWAKEILAATGARR